MASIDNVITMIALAQTSADHGQWTSWKECWKEGWWVGWREITLNSRLGVVRFMLRVKF